MRFSYPGADHRALISTVLKACAAVILLLSACFTIAYGQQNSQELVFKNATLESGNAGDDAAIYRFPSVMSGIDALVKINGRSSSMVKLVTIDLTTTGFEKAFQPQVTYGDNNSPSGNADWWMEFQISFVQSFTNTPASISGFNVTGIDIDGNGDKISEYQSYYGLQSYTIEGTTQLTTSSIKELVSNVLTETGKRFDGPVTNYDGVDTNATTVMVTSSYSNATSFRVRTGAKSTGVSGAADRMYSMWFKAFTYQAAVIQLLPVTLADWSAMYVNNTVKLAWSTTQEINASHFILERSFDGQEYSDIAMLFAAGNSNTLQQYAYSDKIPAGNSGMIYYRLKMVDQDSRYKLSPVKAVRIGDAPAGVKVIAYPNPVVNELRVTVPQDWQGKSISYQLTNANGQIVQSYTAKFASQTEIINMSQVPPGMYVLRAIKGSESAVQAIIKAR